MLSKLPHPHEGGWQKTQEQGNGAPQQAQGDNSNDTDNDSKDAKKEKDSNPYKNADPSDGDGQSIPVSVSGVGENSAESQWLEQNSFRARDGAYVTVKESLDNSEEVWMYVCMCVCVRYMRFLRMCFFFFFYASKRWSVISIAWDPRDGGGGGLQKLLCVVGAPKYFEVSSCQGLFFSLSLSLSCTRSKNASKQTANSLH